MFNRDKRQKTEGNIIDIEAGLQGDVQFNSPVNLKISGRFEGMLEAKKGVLIIGEKADVEVKIIKGERITVAGKVKGDIASSKHLELLPSAKVIGNIKTPILIINEGAMLKGNCQMPVEGIEGEPEKKPSKKREKKKQPLLF